MADRVFNVLFLCTGNTARSILAEIDSAQRRRGALPRLLGGKPPKGAVNPFALKVLESFDYPTDGLRSKGWDEFAAPGAPEMDFVFTVCDDAAGEACPVWPGQPMTAHWGIEDPAAVEGTDIQKEAAFVLGGALSQEPDFRLHKPAAQEPRQTVARRASCARSARSKAPKPRPEVA